MNFWTPLTCPRSTRTTLWLETEGAKFQPLDIGPGQVVRASGHRTTDLVYIVNRLTVTSVTFSKEETIRHNKSIITYMTQLYSPVRKKNVKVCTRLCL